MGVVTYLIMIYAIMHRINTAGNYHNIIYVLKI